MPKPLTLAIVIPAYNEESQIKASLDSIAAQTEKPDEVIVVDNNSTDKTVQVAKSYPFVKIICEKQQGIVFARDQGFNAVKASLIGRIDADTILPERWVEHVHKHYRNTKATHALTGNVSFYNLPAERFYSWLTGQIAFKFNRLIMGHYILLGSNMVIPKNVWLSVRRQTCHRNDIHEDIDLAIHLHRLGYKITYDETLKVRVKARRLFSDLDKLWGHFFKWPRTIKVHGGLRWLWALLVTLAVFLNPILWLHYLLAKYVMGYKDERLK